MGIVTIFRDKHLVINFIHITSHASKAQVLKSVVFLCVLHDMVNNIAVFYVWRA
jgi:hypothetical protein